MLRLTRSLSKSRNKLFWRQHRAFSKTKKFDPDDPYDAVDRKYLDDLKKAGNAFGRNVMKPLEFNFPSEHSGKTPIEYIRYIENKRSIIQMRAIEEEEI